MMLVLYGIMILERMIVKVLDARNRAVGANFWWGQFVTAGFERDARQIRKA
jgi:hypothetical protein